MAGWVLAFLQGVCKPWQLDDESLSPELARGSATGKNHSMISQLLWVLKQPLTMAPQATSESSKAYSGDPYRQEVRPCGQQHCMDVVDSEYRWSHWDWVECSCGTFMEKSWEIPFSKGKSFTSEIKWVIANWWIRPVPQLFVQSGLSPAHHRLVHSLLLRGFYSHLCMSGRPQNWIKLENDQFTSRQVGASPGYKLVLFHPYNYCR